MSAAYFAAGLTTLTLVGGVVSAVTRLPSAHLPGGGSRPVLRPRSCRRVEAMADAVSSIPVPGMRIVAGRKPGLRQNARSAASGVDSG